MATVYKAKCLVLNRYVAVKILKDEYYVSDDKIKVLYGLNRFSYKKRKYGKDTTVKVDANNRFFWDYFKPEEILNLIEANNQAGGQDDV